jgi:hypothetical protein
MRAAEKAADAFIRLPEVAEEFRAFDGGSALDPLLVWSAEWHCNDDVRQVMLLEDWYGLVTQDGGTVYENAEYLEQRWKSPRHYADRINSMFRTSWSKRLIEQRNWLFMHAVWGLRRRDLSGRARHQAIVDTVNWRVHQLAATHLWIPLLKEYIQPTRLLLCPHWADEGEHNIPIRESFPEIDHFKLWGHCPPASWGGYWPGEITDADDPHRYRSDAEIIKDIEAQEAEKDRIGRELAKTHKTQWINYVGVEIKECMKSPGMVCAGQLARWYDEARGDRPVA